MPAIYTWLQRMMGGDETKATVVAVSIAVIGAVVLVVELYFAMLVEIEPVTSRQSLQRKES
jgi:hypothetical protein